MVFVDFLDMFIFAQNNRVIMPAGNLIGTSSPASHRVTSSYRVSIQSARQLTRPF